MEKGQLVRLIDVLILGPYLMHYTKNDWSIGGRFLWLSGVATVFYNGWNFIGNEVEGWPELPV